MIVAGGVLSPLELCDVNGDGLPDILVVFTALMNASVRGKQRSSFPFLFLYMSVQTSVLCMGTVLVSANLLHCSFQSSLKWLVYCVCALSRCS